MILQNKKMPVNASGGLLPMRPGYRRNTGFPSAYPVPKSTPFADFGRNILDAFSYTPDPNTTYMERVGKNLAGDMESMISGFDAKGNKVPDSLRMMSLMMPGGTGLGGKAGVGILGAATGASPKVGSAYASRLMPTLENMPQEKMSADQFSGWLSKQPVGSDELEYSGIPSLLDEGGDVTKTGLLDQAIANPLDIQDVVLGDHTGVGQGLRTKFSDYQLPGGEDYREMLLTLPNKPVTEAEARSILNAKPDAKLSQADIDYASRKNADQFRSGHFDQPNVLAHARYNTRTIDGDKTLFVEEIQSDWHQKGRDVGYKDDEAVSAFYDYSKELAAKYDLNPNQSLAMYKTIKKIDAAEIAKYEELQSAAYKGGSDSVPDAPYKRTDKWAGLTLQRMVKEAVDSGHDRIAWTPGKVQIDRYEESLRRNVDEITYEPNGDGTYNIAAEKNGGIVHDADGVTTDEIKELYGKDVADKIGKDVGIGGDRPLRPDLKVLREDDLSIGGDGMKEFYDKMLVKSANKFGKKYGAKVEVKKVQPKENSYNIFDESGMILESNVPAGRTDELIAEYNRGDGTTAKKVIINDYSQEVWSMKITPEMKAGISKGVMLGKTGGEGKIGAGLLQNQNEQEQMLDDAPPVKSSLFGTMYGGGYI